MRIVLALLCVVAGAGIGIYKSTGLKRRETLLTEIIALLESMAVQIRYRAPPLGDLFESLSNSGDFIHSVFEMRSAQNWRGAWNEAVESFPELDDGDKELLLSIGLSLGSSDVSGQVAMLELNRELLSARQKQASEAAFKKGAMYRSVGFLAGLALAIIII